ncbi:MAG: MFS transporter [Chloroflexi bacterium]|nr:MFS transporter [Chloroflexota bacterium]
MIEVTIEQANKQHVAKNMQWNFIVNVWDEIFVFLGISLVSRETVMPVLVAHLTHSKLAIGLIPAIFALGMYLPQLLVANFSERMRYKKPYIMWVSGPGERGGYLLMGLTIWWLAPGSPTVALVLFFLFLAVSATCIGVAMPAWYDMIAKVIPTNRRGLFSGVGHSLGALASVIAAFFVGWVLERLAFPNNFALLFLAAFIAMSISWIGLSLTREPPSTTVKAHMPLARYLRQLPVILRKDSNYLRYLLSRSTIQLGTMASGFYVVYGIERFQIDGATVGLLTAALVGSAAIMNLVWGFVSDRRGHKLVLASSAFALVLAALIAWLATSQVWLIATFILLGVYSAGDAVSSLNIILEFCAPEDRPTYIGLTNTLLAPVLTLGPLLGGWLAMTTGYTGLFAAALLFACVGSVLMTLWVREPRRA